MKQHLNPTCWQRRRGFTIIELMVTIALAAAMLSIAVPGFTEFRRNSQLTSATNKMLAAINITRSEAMKRASFVMMVPRDGANWKNGWRIFADKNLNMTFDAATDEIIADTGDDDALPDYLAVASTGTDGDGNYILFNGSGYSRTKTGAFNAMTISIARNDIVGETTVKQQTRRIKMAATGRVRSCRPDTDSHCLDRD